MSLAVNPIHWPDSGEGLRLCSREGAAGKDYLIMKDDDVLAVLGDKAKSAAKTKKPRRAAS